MSAAGSSRSRASAADPAALRSAFGGLLVAAFALAGAIVAAQALSGLAAAGGCDLGLPAAVVAFGVDCSVASLAVASLLRPRLFGGLVPLALLGLALALGLFVVAELLGLVPCPAGSTLATLSVATLAAAALYALPGIRSRGWARVLRRRPASRIEAPFVALTLAILCAGVAALLYQSERGAAVVVAPERPAILDLPAAGVAFGADEPEIVAAYFVDVDSSPCRDEFRAVTASMRDPKLAGAFQLRLYHAPQVEGGCFAGDGPQPALRIDEASCLSAAAIECVELLAPGAGIRMAGELFDRRRGATGSLETATILEAASTLGLRVAADQPGDPLLRCITSNRAIHGRLAAHAEFAAQRGAAEVPHGYFVGVDDQRLDPARVEVFRGHLTADLRERKISSVRGASDAPVPTAATPAHGASRH